MSDGHKLVTWRGSDNTCFGCSDTNPRGLGLEFWQTDDHTVECRLTPDTHLGGAPAVVHGGVQAVILDECMGYACHTISETWDVATVDLSLRFRRPVPTEEPMVASATVDEVRGDWISLTGEIRNAEGDILTRAEGRWKVLGDPAGQPDQASS